MNLLPGDVGFSTIHGWVGVIPNIGQAILNDGCRYSHTYMYIGDGKIIEAMPGGARIVQGADRPGPWFRFPLSVEQMKLIPHYAETLEGLPYGYMTYPALAWHEYEWVGHNLLRSYVSKSRRMICSQAVDHLLMRVDYHVFDDGRWPQDVTPGDLWYACVDQAQRLY